MKITVTNILLLPVAFTVSLILFRVFYSGSLMYLFFVWNLFLAAIPFIVSSYLLQLKSKKLCWLLFAIWILFFPNALYIITDLVHLKERNNIPLWFDVILIFSAATNGLMMAFLSLYQVELFLLSIFNKQKTNFILFSCLFVSSFGVYIGRFLRWNSWDIFFNPFQFILEIIQPFVNPFQHPRTWAVTIILFFFFGIFYFIIKKLPGLFIKPGNQLI
ncbi:MAG TPA: DUF1361 domain-containing protein [Ginsengibacter sp.]